MSDGTQAVELMPCPFCGGKAVATDYDTEFGTWSVKCNSDDSRCVVAMHSYNSADEAVAAWNQRVKLDGASVSLWTDNRICRELGIVSDAQIDYATSFSVGMDVAVKVSKEIRDDYEAHRGASVPNRHAYDHAPTVDEYTRNILESMVDDWLNRYEPGAMEWSDAQVIRAWLDNYSGTFYGELEQAHRGASVPSEVLTALRDVINLAEEHGDAEGYYRNELQTVRAWLAQQRGQG